jgi:hypothetical protein
MLDRVGDVLQHAAELAVVLVAEGFQVDLVRVDVRADEIEHLRRAVAVGDVRAAQAARLRFLEHVDGPFAGDQRLVVARRDDRRAMLNRDVDELLRRRASAARRRRDRAASGSSPSSGIAM